MSNEERKTKIDIVKIIENTLISIGSICLFLMLIGLLLAETAPALPKCIQDLQISKCQF